MSDIFSKVEVFSKDEAVRHLVCGRKIIYDGNDEEVFSYKNGNFYLNEDITNISDLPARGYSLYTGETITLYKWIYTKGKNGRILESNYYKSEDDLLELIGHDYKVQRVDSSAIKVPADWYKV